VHGVIRRASLPNTGRIDHIFDPDSKQYLHYGDLANDIDDLLYDIKPDEVYNLGSMSHVRVSFDIPVYTADVTGIGPLRILEGLRKLNMKQTRFYQASSSEMFGETPPPQGETSSFKPVSPYGCAKLFGYHITKSYRKGYGMFAANGILFNHESERRGLQFVTRKITRAAARIKLKKQESLTLGNLDAVRDWGHSHDYMRAVHMILQHDKPDDFIVSTGDAYSVRDFLDRVFEYLNLDWKHYVKQNSSYTRPNEVPSLIGNSDKIRNVLGWEPKISFDQLVKRMVDNDLKEESKCDI